MRTLLLLPVWFVLFMGALSMLYPEAMWVGGRTVTLRFTVLDAVTQSPIADARVRLYDPDQESDLAQAQTSAVGQAEITQRYMTKGRSSLLRKKGAVYYGHLFFEVSAEGYEPEWYRLAEYTGKARDTRLPDPAPIVIRLDRDDAR